MKLFSIMLTSFLFSGQLAAESPVEYKATIKLFDLVPFIMLDDYTIWILIDEHWMQVIQGEHAEWCGCEVSSNIDLSPNGHYRTEISESSGFIYGPK
jgi:hypothetical protein